MGMLKEAKACTSDAFIEPMCFLGVILFLVGYPKIFALKNKLFPQPEEAEEGRDGWFWTHDREYEEWKKNEGGPAPPPFFFRYQSDNKVFAKYLMQGVIGRTWKHACISGCVGGLIEWAIFHVYCRDPTKMGRDVVEKLLPADTMFTTIQRLVTFVLAVYVNGRMKKHAQITGACWSLRGSLINISVLLGSYLDNSSEEIIKWKFDCYRYLNYMHFLVYKAINAEELGTFDLAFWVDKKILTAEDAVRLKGQHYSSAVRSREARRAS